MMLYIYILRLPQWRTSVGAQIDDAVNVKRRTMTLHDVTNV